MELGEFISEYHVFLIVVFWLISFGIGVITVSIWKKGMDTAQGKTHACDYVILGSLKFNEKKDRYLYSTVTKVRRQQSSSSVRVRR